MIEDALERDQFMTPDEAKDFGLIDEVVSQRPATRRATAAAAKNQLTGG